MSASIRALFAFRLTCLLSRWRSSSYRSTIDRTNAPTAKAGPNKNILTGEKVNFDGSNSKASDGSSIILYEWDFDNDGIIDLTGEKTSYTFTKKGIYTVTLKITDSIGVTNKGTCEVNVSESISYNMVIVAGGIIIFLALVIFSVKRTKKPGPSVVVSTDKEETVPVKEDISLEEKKKELERIKDILQTFKDTFEKGEMDEETYLRLNKKYGDELKRLE